MSFFPLFHKIGACPTCKCDDGAYLDAGHSNDGKPIWKCRDCEAETPRLTRKTKARMAREARLEAILESIE